MEAHEWLLTNASPGPLKAICPQDQNMDIVIYQGFLLFTDGI